jgi:hypothetical protein
MPQPTPSVFFPRQARGGISWVTAVLILLLAGAAYLAWTWGPVFIVNLMVKQTTRDFMNQAVKNPNDAELVENLAHKLRTLDLMQVPDEKGNLVKIATVQVESANVTWQRDTSVQPPMLHVQFEYTRPVAYPLLNRWTQTTLHVDITQDLERPDWGPAR